MRLDFNENTVGCSPRILDCLRSMNAEELAKYPEREPVEAMVAEFLGRPQEEVLLTNGVDEAIHLLCETYLEREDEAIVVVPTYSMYRIYVMAAGAKLVSVPLAEDDFGFSTQRVISSITERTRLIAIANPNNPTGTVVPEQHLHAIAQAAPQAAGLIDEAYFEFYGQTMLKERRVPNLFVARTFSKVYGMAGLRVGVLVGDPEQLKALRRAASPSNVNGIALACLPEAMADQAYVESYVAEVKRSRTRLENALAGAGVQFWQSQANFILMKVGRTKSEAAAFSEAMRNRGILVRDRSADYGCEGCVRITLGPTQHCDHLLIALQETLEELAIARGALQP
jgi:histidinol-phosphate aminotransferase